MRYTKPPLNFKQQAELLISRGLMADEKEIESFLRRVNYYRFTGYLYPFRLEGSDIYQPGTTFKKVRNIYLFDKELRLLTFSAIEEIEISLLRTQMVEKFALANGAFCYIDRNNFHHSLSSNYHQSMLEKIQHNIDRSNEEFIGIYRSKYTSETQFPFWMAAEAITFGQLSIIFSYLPKNIQVPMAKQLNLHSRGLVSWLHTLTSIRNICAHHARLWNRVLPIKPTIPSIRYHPEFHTPEKIKNDSYFVILAILKYLMENLSPGNKLIADFSELVSRFPDVPLYRMGFPDNWQDYAIFQ